MESDTLYGTGNLIVDEMANISFTGNIVPPIWYKTIAKENGKPYLAAITILSDIVYWYKPSEIRDEITGQLIGFKKKFHADLLQRSYGQMADLFGISKRQAIDATIFLEEKGVIKRVFRTIEQNGIQMNNVLFIELNTKRLKALTFPKVAPPPT